MSVFLPFSRHLTADQSLETRAAAEETIEQLHGKLVRGWNDPGCRISVRFADSAEQRELRVRALRFVRRLSLNKRANYSVLKGH